MPTTPSITYPAANVQGSPYGADRLVAEGSRYLTDSSTATGTLSTELLDKIVRREIIDTTPTPYQTFLKLLFSMAPEGVNNLEWAFHETDFQFAPIIVDDVSAEGVAVAGGFVDQVVTITAESFSRTGINQLIGGSNGYRGTVIAMDSGAGTITVRSLTGRNLPALAAGDQLTTAGGEVGFDGQTGVYSMNRATTISRYNYLQEIRVFGKWNRNEEEVWRLSGRTNYMEVNSRKLKERMQYIMATTFLNGIRGQAHSTVTGEVARTTHGIWPWMQEYGSTYVQTLAASAQAVFETISLNTNYTGNDIAVVCHQEIINLIATWYKTQLVRYQPTDMTANLDLQAVVHGGRRFVLTPCNGFRAPGLLENEWKNRMLIYDMNAVKPKKFSTRTFIEDIPRSKQLIDGDGAHKTYSVFGYQTLMGMEMNNAAHASAIDIIDL